MTHHRANTIRAGRLCLLLLALAGAPAVAADVVLKDPADGARTKMFVATAYLLGGCDGRLTPATQARAQALVAIWKLKLTPDDEIWRGQVAVVMADALKAGAEYARMYPEKATPAECEPMFERQFARLAALP